MVSDAPSLNQHEKEFLIDQLNRSGMTDKSVHYHKIWAVEEGKKFEGRIKDYANKDMIALVVNFVDILAHKSSQTDVLKEMVPNESSYRTTVKYWLEHSWLFQVLKHLASAADSNASSGVRYKYGRNLNTNEKHALVIKEPEKYRLPVFGAQPSYVIAKDDNYFVYPNEAHKYQEKFNNSFQHGGISLEEMIIPLAIMKGKN